MTSSNYKPHKTIAEITAEREAFEREFEMKHGRKPTNHEWLMNQQAKERKRLLAAHGKVEHDGVSYEVLEGIGDPSMQPVNNAVRRTRI